MRRIAAYLTATLLVIALLALAVAGCGDATNAQAGPTTPEGILNQAITAAEPIASGTGQFDLTLAVNGDQTKMPAEVKAMLAQPITVTGTISASQDPMALDLAMTASFAGQNLPLGMKMTGGKAWIQFMGMWYEAPAEFTSAMSTPTSDAKTMQESVLAAFKAAGIDMTTWITGLKLVGEDDLDGTKAYHIAGTIDVNKVFSDVIKLSQDKNFQSILGMGATGGTATSPVLPAGEMEEIQKQITSMFQTLAVDVWITKDGYQARKAAIEAKIVPPAGEDSQGIDDITLKMSFSMAPTDSPVIVTPPTGAKPFSELEQALSGLMGMFSGALGEGPGDPGAGQ